MRSRRLSFTGFWSYVQDIEIPDDVADEDIDEWVFDNASLEIEDWNDAHHELEDINWAKERP